MNPEYKILTVEDEAPLREAISKRFQQEDFVVLTAKDGAEGLKVALEEKPDVIILDLLMPGKSGMDMLKELRANSWGKNAAVIIMTNYSESDKVNEAIENRADYYMVKADWSLEDIVSQVHELIDKKE